MTKKRILLPAITLLVGGAAAGTVGTLDLPLGYRYHDIELVYVDSATTTLTPLTLFGDIVIFKNTKDHRTHSAAELDYLNGLNGSQYLFGSQTPTGAGSPTSVAGGRQSLPIYFAEPWRKDKVDTDFLAWNVAASWGWKTFQIKVTLLAAMPATGSVVAYAWVDDVQPVTGNGLQPIVKCYRQQITCGGSSTDVTTVDQKDAIQVIALKNPTAYPIQKVTAKRNGVVYYDQVAREDNVMHLAHKGIVVANSATAGAFAYPMVFDAADPVNDALVAEGQAIWLQIICTGAATGSFFALIQRLGPFDV